MKPNKARKTANRAGIQSGNLAGFILNQLARRGANISPHSAPPVIETTWRFRPDEYGFVVRVLTNCFPAFDEWLASLLGEPSMKNGHPFRMWSRDQIGVVLQLVGCPRGLQICCVSASSAELNADQKVVAKWVDAMAKVIHDECDEINQLRVLAEYCPDPNQRVRMLDELTNRIAELDQSTVRLRRSIEKSEQEKCS